MDLEQDLRTVSDDMMSTLDQLQKLESEKRAENPGSPRFVRLAREIERLAAVVFSQTSAQQSLAEQTHAAAQSGAEMSPSSFSVFSDDAGTAYVSRLETGM